MAVFNSPPRYSNFTVTTLPLSQVLKPVTALVIVDVQYDFIDGTLSLRNCPAGQDGADVVPIINKLLEEARFDVVVYSLDWHPADHISFIDNVEKWPVDKSSLVSGDRGGTYSTLSITTPITYSDGMTECFRWSCCLDGIPMK